jgi:hypothetical protein
MICPSSAVHVCICLTVSQMLTNQAVMSRIQVSIVLTEHVGKTVSTFSSTWTPASAGDCQQSIIPANGGRPVTDNLNSCQGWAALQNSIWLVKRTCAPSPSPSQERAGRKDTRSDTLGLDPHSGLPYVLSVESLTSTLDRTGKHTFERT